MITERNEQKRAGPFLTLPRKCGLFIQNGGWDAPMCFTETGNPSKIFAGHGIGAAGKRA